MNRVKNLRKLRLEKDLSQQQLANLLNSTQQSIYKYEKGIASPNLEMLMNMADFFETSVDYLIGYTDIPHKVEPVTEYSLNIDEEFLIKKYRKMNPRTRQIIHSIIDEYLQSAGRA